MSTEQSKSKHLLNRAGFGIGADELNLLENADVGDILNQLLETSYSKIQFDLPTKSNVVKKMEMGGKLNADEQRTKRRLLFKLQDAWMNRMCVSAQTGNPLLERMSLFWHGHFACRIKDFRLASNYLETIRKNALGNFKDLLLGISKDAAMIRYLNNQQNVKNKPNENFARELLELFSMGIGNYAEKDIKEAARAFTGWSSNKNGEFKFKRKRHDTGMKTFLGRTGNFSGEDIIDIILEQKQTASFIASELYEYFVNVSPKKEHVAQLAETLIRSNYELKPVIRQMFSSDWFYDESNVGTKIKSPIDLIIGLRKLLNLSFPEFTNVVYLQRILGQELFNPPNVSGWERDLKWINNATLVYRLKLGHLLLQKDTFELTAKTEQEGFNFNKKERNRFSQVKFNLNPLYRFFERADKSNLNTVIGSYLLADMPVDKTEGSNKSSSKSAILEEILNTIALPEYQVI